MRIFIAINFSEDVKNRLSETVDRIRKYSKNGTFTTRDNLHLTLVFIGETENVKAIFSAVDKIDYHKFELGFKGVGRFRRDGGDIYWVGVENNDQLAELQRMVNSEIINAGFKVEDRPFKPHLTLGRRMIMDKSFNVSSFSEEFGELKESVDKVSVMKSERINGKLTYTEIYKKDLI